MTSALSSITPYIPSIVSTAGSVLGGNAQSSAERDAADKAAQTARLGFDYLTGSPVATQYLPAGAAANNAIAALLGVGGGGAPGSASSAPNTMTPGMIAASQVKNFRNADNSGAIGSAAGAAAGSFIPGVGTAVGSLIGKVGGNFLGNVFGANNASPIQDIAAALSRGIPVSDKSWAEAGYGPGGAALGSTPQAPGSASGAPNAQAGYNNAFNNYLKSTGYQFQLGEGTRAITGSAAARGLLDSGATAKALTSYGQNLASTSFNNYMAQLGALSGQGLQAGQAIGSAGSQAGAAGAGQIGAGYGAAAGTAGSTWGNAFGGISDILNRVMLPKTGPGTPPIAPGSGGLY